MKLLTPKKKMLFFTKLRKTIKNLFLKFINFYIYVYVK